MKKRIIIFALVICLLLSSCVSIRVGVKVADWIYKNSCIDTVYENLDYLNKYVAYEKDFLTKKLMEMGVQKVEVNYGVFVFPMYYTGLFDGGIEFGFYYAENDHQLSKCVGPLDFMVVEPITGHWYYYEYHNG